ncbi:AraC-like DNA-binding protein [Chryseobacterium sp. 52]|uniref:helix-turn-helix transcriptional regulator n=1 Tax=Chryseobacterium sp. 52 TaxID=2035213 RepID=UPI000C1A1948|nr:AraC family transcriptional regulator [Chryseobacterium sp. 52]PIF45389.1 AraC-like DNA-binding protein [Chryseobacterium sp. 52]
MEKDNPTIPNVLKNLAHSLGVEIGHRTLWIPPKFGHGYCSGFIFNEHIRMLISNYELNEDVILENPDFNTAKRMIFFKFQNIFPDTDPLSTEKQVRGIPSVLIATSRINTDHMISIHSNTSTINIEMDADYLNALFYTSEKSPVLQSLLQNSHPYLFEQMMHPSLQKIVDEILSETIDENFELFFLRIKAEELICRLLMELEKRDEKRLYVLNSQDIGTIYKVREHILEHLEIPPVIGKLAEESGMSPTKLKRLFKQIFGDSIFRYYQQFRIQKASLLLKEKKYSVSEVGYMLGFTNLSHFSKIFHEHIGMKPKQYAMM